MVILATFPVPDHAFGRVFYYLHSAPVDDQSRLELTVQTLRQGHPPEETLTQWAIHSSDVPAEVRLASRRHVVRVCRPLERSSFTLLRA